MRSRAPPHRDHRRHQPAPLRHPHPHGVRSESGQAQLVESVVTDQGDWAFNATGTLALNAPEAWDPIPKDKQDSREVIQAAGDAYFNRFGNTSVVVPWGRVCYRLEGGFKVEGTLKGDDCEMVWPSTIHVPYRRYVVDQEMGVVDLFIGFPGLDRSQGQAPMRIAICIGWRVGRSSIAIPRRRVSCVEAGVRVVRSFGRNRKLTHAEDNIRKECSCGEIISVARHKV